MALRIACVGIGGFARNYVDAALTLMDEGKVVLMAAADPRAGDLPETVERLKSRGARLYADMDALFDAEKDIDLVTIGTGLHLHYPMAMKALERGVHVYLAKPSTPLVQNVDRMTEAAERAGRVLAVDFQHAYTEGAQAIKQAIADGLLGRIRTVTAALVWCRQHSYYARTGWAGRVKLNGEYVLDGPMNNPHAHYLNNALYFSSPERHAFAMPVTVQAELYKAHDIEGEDTAFIRCRTDTDVDIFIGSTLCGEDNANLTQIHVFGTEGEAVWTMTDYAIRPKNGPAVEKTFPRSMPIWSMRNVVESIESGRKPTVTIRDTRNHVLLTNGAYESARTIRRVPGSEVFTYPAGGDDKYVAIRGINAIIRQAASERKLPSQLGVPWAVPTRPFDMKGYTTFAMEPAAAG